MLWIETVLLFILAFLPPIIYVIWIRNTEKHNRERWKSIIICFMWGATIAVVAAIFLEFILEISLVLSMKDFSLFDFVAIVVIAPFAEELVKPLALRVKTVKKELTEPEDGLIYGAVAGLGFSATENLLYGYNFFSKGFMIFLMLMIIRSVGGCLLHASATALTGYGYGKSIMHQKSLLRVIPFFIVAILLHAFYNFVVSYEEIGLVAGLLTAILFVILTIHLIRKKIRNLDGQRSLL